MKINFDQIFQAEQPSRPANKSYWERPTTATNSRINEPIDFAPPENRKPLAKKPKVTPSAYIWYVDNSLSKSLEAKSSSIQKKLPAYLPKKQAAKLVQKLYQTPECRKKECVGMIKTEYRQKAQQREKLIMEAQQYRKRKEFDTKLWKAVEQKEANRKGGKPKNKNKEGKGELHERLYRDWMTRQFNSEELELKIIRESNSKQRIYQNPKYLKDYRSFYERLPEQVDKKVSKQKFYDSHPDFLLRSSQGQLYTPNLKLSSRSIKMCHLDKTYFPKNQRTNTTISDTLNTSAQSINLNIIQKKEHSYFKKLGKLFSDQSGNFAITAQAVEELQESEFNILYPLIAQLQSSGQSVSKSQFTELVRKYYKSIPITERQQLRQTRMSKHKNNNKNRDVHERRSTIESVSSKEVKRGVSFANYHEKIKQFV